MRIEEHATPGPYGDCEHPSTERLRGSVYSINSRRESRIHAHESVYSINSRRESGANARGWIAWAIASVACILAAALAVAFLAREAASKHETFG